MRDYGFDFYYYDKYAKNQYARGFEADVNKKYVLITAFENFEHFVNPLKEIENIMKLTDVLHFSTCLISSNPPLVKDWWYYAPVAGQHISFYSLETLNLIAKKFECQLISDGYNFHILSKIPIQKDYFKQLEQFEKKRYKYDITNKLKKESKIGKDFEMILLKKL